MRWPCQEECDPKWRSSGLSQLPGQKTNHPLAPPPPRRYPYPMIANPNSRSPGSIPNNRCDTLAPPVPILRRATPPPRRVPSSGKRLEGWSHATIVPILPLPARPILPPPGPCPHPHETRVNRTSCAQNDPPFTIPNPLRSPRKSTFPAPESDQPPNPALFAQKTGGSPQNRFDATSCCRLLRHLHGPPRGISPDQDRTIAG